MKKLVAVLPLPILAACTLLVDTDDLSGGPDTTPADDAAPGIDVVIPDGSNTGTNDAGDASSPVLACNAPGLVAYFPFDENQGTTTRDCSGNALVGTFAPDAGPTWTQGIRNSALHFENTFVTLGQPSALDFSGTRALSVAAFIRIGAVADADRPAIVSRTGQSGKRGWELAISDASENRSGIFRVSPDNQTEVEVYTATPLPLGQWVHLAATYQPGGKMRIYIDGTFSAETAAPASTIVAPVNAVIGGRSYDYFWKGDLDEVRIFDRALADTDVAALAAR